MCYETGEGVIADAEKAFYWHMQSAEQGDDRAQLHVGWSYMLGNGIYKDGGKCLDWLLKSAEQGNAQAMSASVIAT